MTIRHTPAPWHCYTKGSDIYVEDAKEHGIANIRRNFDLPFNEKMANAYLITAAPDLLVSLIALLNEDMTELEIAYWYEKARAAIAKATGDIT
jgi:hypothetical protein